jgi:hypothetical protein
MKNTLNWIGIIFLSAALAGLAWVILGQLVVIDTARPGAFNSFLLPSSALGIFALALLAATRTRAA